MTIPISEDPLQKEKQTLMVKALSFLETQCQEGFFPCQLSSDLSFSNLTTAPREVASSLLILEIALKHFWELPLTQAVLYYVKSQLHQERFSFFENLVTIPPDTETTSWGLATLLDMGEVNRGTVEKVAGQIVAATDKRGIIEIYFPPCWKENRIDHVSAVNTLYLLELLGRTKEATTTEKWVLDMLTSGGYRDGSRYYHLPETFLYFLSRYCLLSDRVREQFEGPLKKELCKAEQINEHPLATAQIITARKHLHLSTHLGEEQLAKLQSPVDGGWPTDAIYHFGSQVGYFGSRSITTAFAIEALWL